MPWTNQGGGGNGSGPAGPRGPWGKGPAGNGGGDADPPGFEDFLGRGLERLRGFMPSGGFTRGSLSVLGAAVVVVWLLTGVYVIDAGEQGVVLRFGAVSAITVAGTHYHLPWPIEVAYKARVFDPTTITVGYQTGEAAEDNSQTGDVPEESRMLTGDENIVDMNFTVSYNIKDAPAYLFNVPNQEQTVKAVAESAMREVVGESQVEPVLTLDGGRIQDKVRQLIQKTVDSYGMGVNVLRVQIRKSQPPADVISSYRDVQAARQDQERKRNEAETYANTIIPQARGQAAHVIQDAEAYRLKVIAEASGQAKRFLAIYAEYRKAPEVTRKRIYLENLAQILGPMNKVIVDDSVKGVVPYFQLPSLQKPAPAPAATAQSPTTQPSQAFVTSGQGSVQ
jgi:membrane protease subunit HflK